MRSAEELWEEYQDTAANGGGVCRELFVEVINADRAEVEAATVQRCVKIVNDEWWYGLGGAFNEKPRDSIVAAIRAVATPPESPRERLGRVLWEATLPSASWENATTFDQDEMCNRADAVRQEIAKMEEEAKNA